MSLLETLYTHCLYGECSRLGAGHTPRIIRYLMRASGEPLISTRRLQKLAWKVEVKED